MLREGDTCLLCPPDGLLITLRGGSPLSCSARLLIAYYAPRWLPIFMVREADAYLLRPKVNDHFLRSLRRMLAPYAPQSEYLFILQDRYLFVMPHKADTYFLCLRNRSLFVTLVEAGAYFYDRQANSYLSSCSSKQTLIHCAPRGGCLFLMPCGAYVCFLFSSKQVLTYYAPRGRRLLLKYSTR